MKLFLRHGLEVARHDYNISPAAMSLLFPRHFTTAKPPPFYLPRRATYAAFSAGISTSPSRAILEYWCACARFSESAIFLMTLLLRLRFACARRNTIDGLSLHNIAAHHTTISASAVLRRRGCRQFLALGIGFQKFSQNMPPRASRYLFC